MRSIVQVSIRLLRRYSTCFGAWEAFRLSAAARVSAVADLPRQGGFSEIFLPLPHENQIHLHRENRKIFFGGRRERVFDTIEALCFD